MLKKIKKVREFLQNEKGVSLIEAILMIIILGITIIPLFTLSTNNVKYGTQTLMMTRGCFYAQTVMESVFAAYQSPDTTIGGLDHTIADWSGVSTSDPPAGYSGVVTFTSVDSLYGVLYSDVTVTVSCDDIPDIVLNARLVK